MLTFSSYFMLKTPTFLATFSHNIPPCLQQLLDAARPNAGAPDGDALIPPEHAHYITRGKQRWRW